MRMLPEEERLETLAILEQNRSEVERHLQALPITIETPSQVGVGRMMYFQHMCALQGQ